MSASVSGAIRGITSSRAVRALTSSTAARRAAARPVACAARSRSRQSSSSMGMNDGRVVPLFTVPRLRKDVHDLAGLWQIDGYLEGE